MYSGNQSKFIQAALKLPVLVLAILLFTACSDEQFGGIEKNSLERNPSNSGQGNLVVPNSQDFGNTFVSQEKIKSLTLVNDGSAEIKGLEVLNITGDYEILSNSCGELLGQDESCVLELSFSPFQRGPRAGSISFQYVKSSSLETKTVTLVGTGQEVARLQFSASPEAFQAYVGYPESIQLNLRNTSQDTAAYDLSFSALGEGYDLVSNDCGVRIPAGAECSVEIKFDPQASGELRTDYVSSYQNGIEAKQESISLVSDGLQSARLALVEGDGNYGEVLVGQTLKKNFTIQNDSTDTAAQIISVGEPGTPFNISQNDCGDLLEKNGGSCNIEVSFAPGAAIDYSESLNIVYDSGPVAQEFRIPLTGSGRSVSRLVINGNGDFGQVYVDQDKDEIFTIQNLGDSPAENLVISSVNAPFSIIQNDCGDNLQGLGTCDISVKAKPEAAQAYSDSLRVSYNDGSADRSVEEELKVKGILPANLVVSEGNGNFGDVEVGKTGGKELVVTNQSTYAQAVGISLSALESPFLVYNETCTGDLAAGESCSLSLRFMPNDVKNYASDLALTYNNGVEQSDLLIPLSGSGIDAPLACIDTTDSFLQPKAEEIPKVDLLFVVDTSSSLNQERDEIAQNIGSFIDQLPEETDLRVGVLLAHVPGSNYAGKLFSPNSNIPKVLSSEDGVGQLRNNLISTLNNTQGQGKSDGGEAGLISLYLNATSSLQETKDLGFYRDDAALSVVFISDEDDICNFSVQPGDPFNPRDGQGVEPRARDDYCPLIPGDGTEKYSTVYNSLKSIQGDRPLLVSGIVYTNENEIPSGGENGKGYGYIETIEIGGTSAIDLAGNQIADGLSTIGTLTTERITTKTSFTLSRYPEQSEPLTVSVNGNALAEDKYEYEFVTNEIRILNKADAGPPEASIAISYCGYEQKPNLASNP